MASRPQLMQVLSCKAQRSKLPSAMSAARVKVTHLTSVKAQSEDKQVKVTPTGARVPGLQEFAGSVRMHSA
jgi:hypothetical protein